MVRTISAIILLSATLLTLAGSGGYEGQPGNQGNGQNGYEGQPGNQGGGSNGQNGYEGQPGNQGGN